MAVARWPAPQSGFTWFHELLITANAVISVFGIYLALDTAYGLVALELFKQRIALRDWHSFKPCRPRHPISLQLAGGWRRRRRAGL